MFRIAIRLTISILLQILVVPISTVAEDNPSVVLTQEERNWISNNSTIRVAGPQAFPPFHFYDTDGEPKGIASEYVQIISETLGVDVEYVPATPWPDVLSSIRSGNIDLIACAAVTEDRESYMRFTEPIFSFPMVIISRRDSPFIAGLDDLHGKNIALVNDVSTFEWLVRDEIVFTPIFAETPLDALRMVSSGVGDVYLGNLAASSYLIEKNGLANLKVAAPTTYGNYSLHIAVRKDCELNHLKST